MKKGPPTNYLSLFVPEINRKLLYKNLDILIDAEFTTKNKKVGGESSKVGGESSQIGSSDKLNTESSDLKTNLDVQLDKNLIYQVIASEFGPFGLSSLINRFIAGMDDIKLEIIQNEVARLSKLFNTQLVLNDKSNILNLASLLPEIDTKNILVLDNNDNIGNKLNKKYDGVVINRYLAFINDKQLDELVKKLNKITRYVIIYENNYTTELNNFYYELYFTLLHNSKKQETYNRKKEDIIAAFNKDFKVINEKNMVSSYLIVLNKV